MDHHWRKRVLYQHCGTGVKVQGKSPPLPESHPRGQETESETPADIKGLAMAKSEEDRTQDKKSPERESREEPHGITGRS